jgi:hypothetical protein
MEPDIIQQGALMEISPELPSYQERVRDVVVSFFGCGMNGELSS